MKLVVLYKEPLKGDERLLPRDIRNYIASITKDDDAVHSVVMSHERKQPTLLYSMPNRKSFAIYSFRKDDEVKELFKKIKAKIEENPIISINGASAVVKEVFTTKWYYTNFKNGLFERRLRTPMVIGASVGEYARARQLSADGEVDMQELQKFVTDTIKESIRFQHRDWFDEEYEADDLMIVYKDLEYTPIRYKEGQYFPAVRGTIICNKELPMFIGYKSGLGFGELSTIKEMNRRKKGQ